MGHHRIETLIQNFKILFLVRITPSAAVVLNSKDKAPYFAYIEVLNTNDKNIDETPSKMLEASLLEEQNNLSDQREILSDEEEIYSGNHNTGIFDRILFYRLTVKIIVSAENHDLCTISNC